MSKAIGIALLLALASDIVSPAVFANSGPVLPLCCRREGKHHCAMLPSAPAQGVLLKAVPERCTFFPKHAAVSGADYSTPPRLAAVITCVYAHPAARAQTEARYRVSLVRGWQKRGPPSLA